MNKEQKSFKSRKITGKDYVDQYGKDRKASEKKSCSRIQIFSEKLYLLGEGSPNYVLGYN